MRRAWPVSAFARKRCAWCLNSFSLSTRSLQLVTLTARLCANQQLETILKHALLQNKQSVEMYAKDAGTGAWALSKRASPGNLQSFEDLLFHRGEQTDNALVMAARLVTSAESKVRPVALHCG